MGLQPVRQAKLQPKFQLNSSLCWPSLSLATTSPVQCSMHPVQQFQSLHNQSFIQFVYSFIQFIHSFFIPSYTHSLTHSFIHSFICSFIYSFCLFVCLLVCLSNFFHFGLNGGGSRAFLSKDGQARKSLGLRLTISLSLKIQSSTVTVMAASFGGLLHAMCLHRDCILYP